MTDDCCPDFDWPIGEVRTFHLWPHGTPLPEGAKHHEEPVITDHHRFYTSVVEIDAKRGG